MRIRPGIQLATALNFVFILIALSIFAQEIPLRNFESFDVNIKISCDHPLFEQEGLTQREMKTKIELRLRQAGMSLSENGIPLLLNVTAVMIEDIRLYAYTMKLEVSDLVIKYTSLPGILHRIFPDYRSYHSDSIASVLAARIMEVETMDDYIKTLNEIVGGNQKIEKVDTSLTYSELENLFMNECFSAGVWSRSYTATAGLDQLGGSEKRVLDSLIDEFINEYLAANPPDMNR